MMRRPSEVFVLWRDAQRRAGIPSPIPQASIVRDMLSRDAKVAADELASLQHLISCGCVDYARLKRSLMIAKGAIGLALRDVERLPR